MHRQPPARRVIDRRGVLVGDNRGVVISSPFVIILSAADQAIRSARVRSGRAEHRMVIRAKIVLAAAEGHANSAISAELGMHIDTVRTWRRRFHHHRLDGFKDRPRSGRPPVFTPVQVAEVKALACTAPGRRWRPAGRWSVAELAKESVAEGVVEKISASTIGRWLAG